MRIAIPSEERKRGTAVSISYGRCPFFMIYDTQSDEYFFVENLAASQESGAGIAASQKLVDSGVDVLITRHCGENAAKVLVAAGIEIYRTDVPSAESSIVAFRDGKLVKLDEFSSPRHQG